MASSSLFHQQNQELNAFSGIDPAGKRRRVSESSKMFDVFINHRGPDVKQTLATQLYNSFERLGIRAFLDSEEKELGNSFPSTIETAILSAKVHIAIFSIRYAQSPWCLAELVLMLQSEAKIIPVFYQVKPSDLRYIEKGAYAQAFIEYRQKGRYLDKLNDWKEALQSLSLIAGEEFYSDRDYGNIVAAVQKEVRRKTPLYVAEYPVGLNNLVEDFQRRCLDELVEDFDNQCKQGEGKDKARVVGIFGLGGSGKTTLAKELFNRKKSNYTTASFLFDVREASTRNELPSLQIKLLKDLFGKKSSFTRKEEGASSLKDHLSRAPSLSSLIVVDDIDHVDQLNALQVMDFLNKSGNSLVIVTTRDAGVLITAGINVGYHLKGMDRNDSRELFCWHAFRQTHPCSGYEVLVDSFVDMCVGLPLSLKVLGGHVHGRDQWFWESELIKARKMLPQDVKQRLKISFDSLDDEQKQVFIDIACFFVGKQTSVAESVLEASGWNAHNAIERLKDKCLVEEKIESLSLGLKEKAELSMHDHLRDLGREMAHERSPPHRLWRPQDLKSLESKGFKNILTIPDIRCFLSIFDKSMGSKVTFFLGQENNRFETSGSLLWLQLEGNSTEQPSMPPWIPLQNLQCLRIRSVQFKTLWGNDMQAPSQLKELQISQTSLKEFPDFRGISDNLENVFLDARGLPIQGLSLLESLSMNLSSIYLRFSTLKGERGYSERGKKTQCESLVIENFKFNGEVDWNNGKAHMRGLEKIEINGEEFLSKILISGIHYPSLTSIKLHNMENLMEVDLTKVKTLNCLDIRNCQKLKILVATSDLPNLVLLNISQCPELERITFEHCEQSKNLSGISNPRNPVESKDKITFEKYSHLKSVSGISNLEKLVELDFSDCEKLGLEYMCLSGMKCLEKIALGRNMMVRYFELDGCQNLKTVEFLCEKLVELRIQGCPVLEVIPEFKGQNCLERIIIDGCGKLACLHVYGCDNLKSVSVKFKSRSLFSKDCHELQGFSGIGDIMELTECPELEELPSLFGVNNTEKFEIYACEKIQNIILPTALNMEKFVIYDCEKIQNIILPTALNKLDIRRCRDLQRVAGTSDLMELRELIIYDCPDLEELPSFARLSCMERIAIHSCEKLQNISGVEGLLSLGFMGLCYCRKALTWNCIQKLKCVPSGLVATGRAEDGAESSLNEDLFCEANIGVDGVIDIGSGESYPE
ncbi:hypothetical protein SUGI_0671230 [Cryptomeria japonica]|uniref:disease resistance protein Roq1 n=1 Tax=Cryptomeria japonica TaxID=3369 RepID=UPI0024149B0B|nr:disease resistance protein Roq1 [Cryptomeria japonica]GLJ33364.1 hypothetical protein SUGI_0671230 [Cryptomeria japonica]